MSYFWSYLSQHWKRSSKVGTRERAVAMKSLIVLALEGMGKTLELCIREAAKFYKQSLKNHARHHSAKHPTCKRGLENFSRWSFRDNDLKKKLRRVNHETSLKSVFLNCPSVRLTCISNANV